MRLLSGTQLGVLQRSQNFYSWLGRERDTLTISHLFDALSISILCALTLDAFCASTCYPVLKIYNKSALWLRRSKFTIPTDKVHRLYSSLLLAHKP